MIGLFSALGKGKPFGFTLNVGSVRNDAGLDYFRPTVFPTTPQNLTMCGWFKPKVDRNYYSGIFAIETPAGHSTQFNELITDIDGTSLGILDQQGGGTFHAYFSTELTIDVWHFLAVVYGPSLMTAHMSVAGGPMETISAPIVNVDNIEVMTFGNTNFHFSEYFNGELARQRAWQAQLTKAELMREMASETAVRSGNIWGDWAVEDSATFAVDSSGNGHDFDDGVAGAAHTDGGGLSVSV